MIKVFQPTDTTYSSNGDIVLQPTKAVVHKEDNGAYYLDLEVPFNSLVERKTKLPDSYVPVNYIESSGTQYIDTGMKATQNTSVELQISNFQYANTKVFGSRSSATSNNFSIISTSSSMVCDFYNYNNNRLSVSTPIEEPITISMNNQKLKINDEEQAIATYNTFTTPSNAYIFGGSGSYASGYTNATMRLYYCKIWDNGTLVRKYIPCFRKSDYVVGLYDLVNGVFYTNAGSGVFTYGGIAKQEDYNDFLVSNNILVANTPQGNQAFRIANIEKTRTKIKIKANHVFFDSANYLIEDSYVVEKDCNDALDHLNSATSDVSPFTTISDVTNIESFRCVRKSLYEAIQVVLERWGGHLVRNNWSIGIYDSIGQDNGVVVRYAKNLKEITASYNWDEVVTKLMPVGKDGLLLNALDPTASVYLTSGQQYEIPFTKTISFEQDISEEDYKDEDTGEVDEAAYQQALIDDLTDKANVYLTEHSVPSVNYTLSANLEKVSDIGDTIEVKDERLGINIFTNIISFDYDCILEKYIQVEFGNFTQQLSNLINNISSVTETAIQEATSTIQVTLNNELQQATSQIWDALSDSYVIYDGDKILIVDTLPKENATNVIMINNGGIGFSNTGINGTFKSAWTIDNVLNMENINVINLTADLIKGGTLKLGSNLNQNGQIEVYDEANTLIAELNKNGLKMYGVDGSYVLINNQVGFAGYDKNDNQIYWVSKDEFHMKKSVIEEEITLCNKMRFIPIEIYNGNTLVNDGIGLVSVLGGGN